jgi:hypothetical protein
VPLRHFHRLFRLFRSWSAYAFDNFTIFYLCAFVLDRGFIDCAESACSVFGAGRAAANQLAQKPGAQLITLDQAIQMALEHNHNLLAARTTIQQNEAEEITANLRPDPVLSGRYAVSADLPAQQFQLGLPGQHGAVRPGRELPVRAREEAAAPLQAAKDQTAVTRWQVADNERTLTFSVATDFINVELAESTWSLPTGSEELSEHGGHYRGATRRALLVWTIC